jgi:hypothetical protein
MIQRLYRRGVDFNRHPSAAATVASPHRQHAILFAGPMLSPTRRKYVQDMLLLIISHVVIKGALQSISSLLVTCYGKQSTFGIGFYYLSYFNYTPAQLFVIVHVKWI